MRRLLSKDEASVFVHTSSVNCSSNISLGLFTKHEIIRKKTNWIKLILFVKNPVAYFFREILYDDCTKLLPIVLST